MNCYVLDASVAAKWFLPSSSEPFIDEALAVLDDYATGHTRLLVPDLFWADLGNILWKATRQKRISPDTAEEILLVIATHGFPTTPCRDLLKDAVPIARAFDRPLYDSLYLALAVSAGCPMLTADEKLVNAVRSQLPVRWLGAL